MPLEISWRVEMRNTSRKTWENEMRIGRVTKWGLGGWHECPATAALGEMWRLTMVSERTEICMNSKSTHSASSIAKWLCWKASKSNFPVLRVLCTQPTSWKWVGEPDYLQTHFATEARETTSSCQPLIYIQSSYPIISYHISNHVNLSYPIFSWPLPAHQFTAVKAAWIPY